MQKINLGNIHADYITMNDAIENIISMITKSEGGYIVTPNVDHVVLSEKNVDLVEAYEKASLSLVDGMPLLWMSRLLGDRLPEKISGSDITIPLLRRCQKIGAKIYLLGAAPGVGIRASEALEKLIPDIDIVGVDSPSIGFENDSSIEEEIFMNMLACEPDIVLVALGCPKQELLMYRWNKKGIKQVMIGIGATLDFIAGEIPRAPKWMSNTGLEWLFRLLKDPKRLVKRYLIQDIKIIRIFFRMLKDKRSF